MLINQSYREIKNDQKSKKNPTTNCCRIKKYWKLKLFVFLFFLFFFFLFIVLFFRFFLLFFFYLW
ncbi:MAG: hypothetical protein EAY69_06575 [Cytophagales bacterium]|nr:MAG: hypothetical protein EAY69_06575 [Cytophagales bacterium]